MSGRLHAAHLSLLSSPRPRHCHCHLRTHKIPTTLARAFFQNFSHCQFFVSRAQTFAAPCMPPSPLPKHVQMTEEIQYYEEELHEIIGEIQKGLDGLRRLHGSAKTEKLAELGQRLQRAKQVLHSFKVEMRDLPRDRSAAYDAKAREFHTQLQTFHGDLTIQKQEAERQAVGVRTVDEMSTQEVLQEAGKVQDQSLGALARMKQNIAASKEVGAATAAQLEAQTRQLKNIDTDVMKVKSNLSRADLLLRAFMRKIMTDKIILIFMLVIFIGIVVIVIYKIVAPDDLEEAGIEVPDEVVPALQSGRRLHALVAAARRLRSSREHGD